VAELEQYYRSTSPTRSGCWRCWNGPSADIGQQHAWFITEVAKAGARPRRGQDVNPLDLVEFCGLGW